MVGGQKPFHHALDCWLEASGTGEGLVSSIFVKVRLVGKSSDG